MAKSVKKRASAKTSNRRMKRTVRRTIGALCMVSAITVAAIPVPDIEAYSPSADPVATYDSLGITTAAASDNLTMASAGYGSLSNSGKTYTLNQQGGVTYLDWQFEYKSQGSGATDAIFPNAFITSYNNNFSKGELDLSSSLLFSDYVYIGLNSFEGLTDTSVSYGSCTVYPTAEYNTNKNISVEIHLGDDTQTASVEKLGIQYTLDGDPDGWSSSNPVYTFFNTYFPSDLLDYTNKYTAYKNAIAAGESPTIPASITRSLLDNPDYDSVDEQQRYLCDKIFGNGKSYGLRLEPTTRYKYNSAGDRDGTEQIYIFASDTLPAQKQFTPSTNYNHIFYTDSQGYVVMKFIQLIGIAENALEGVVNITNVTLGGNIQFICDRAFSGSNVLSSIAFGGNAKVGNQSFYNCQNLTSADLSGVQSIGKESFAGTKIDSISIPESLITVEDGAFYNCTRLSSVVFEAEGTNPTTIGKAAFCDLEVLNSVDFGNRNISQIGDYAFAITDTSLIGKDKLTDFKYPDYITKGVNLGEFTLANRQALKNVILSSGLRSDGSYNIDTGAGTPDVPDTLVAGCTNLGMFQFPAGTNGMTYDPTMFYDVVNPDFYVYGPEKNGSDYAAPRQCTWRAGMDVANNTPNGLPVTYMYYKDDNEANPATYEIASDGLIQGIDATGKLVNCTYVPGTADADKDVDLIIPSSVAGITINAIDSNCFDDDIKKNVTGVKIEDGNGIATIEDNVFQNFDAITFVDLGDGVHSIGNTAFNNCDELRKVTIGENIESVGSGAFSECPKLTEIHFDTPGSLTDFTLEKIGTDAFATGSDKLTVFGEIGPDYGPFAWSMQKDNYVDPAQGIRVCYKTNSPSNLTVILDNKNGLPTLVDYPHYEDIDPAILSNPNPSNVEQDIINATKTINIPEGIKSIDVKGYIDGTSESGTASANPTSYNNNKNVQVYLDPLTATDADGNKAGLKYFDTYKEYGLFNGYFGDTDNTYTYGDADEYYMSLFGKKVTAGNTATLPYEGSNKETNPIGNDYVEAIVMNDVEYLPDLAFYNCEKLQMLALGDNMEDVGALPIADCTDLASLGSGTSKYVAENGILYENKDNGNKKIVEVFPGRGDTVGSRTVNNANDPSIDNVDEIAEGAFSDCDVITFVELEGIQADTIPKYCFYDCDNLREVDLPTTVDEDIEDNAFGKDPGIHVKAESKEVYLSPDAFGDITSAETPIYEIYRGSASEKPSQRLGKNKVAAELKYIGEKWTVTFYNYDGTEIISKVEVEDGGTAVEPEKSDIPVREGYTFVGWSKSLRGIHEDTFVIAMYEPNSNTTPGVTNGVVNPTQAAATDAAKNTSSAGSTTKSSSSSSTKYTLTVVYGSGSGQYPEKTKVIIEAIDAPAGKVFDKWVVTGAAATVYSSTSKATTVTTAAGETIITATYKDAGTNNTPSSGSGSGTKASSTGTYSRTGTNGSPAAGTGSSTRVDITKPGISDVDKAYASVSGSTDSFVVKITESADAANQVATALANKYGDMTPIKYFAMDISLYDATGTNKITDTTGLKVNVTMPIPDALRQYAGNNKVGAVVNGTQLEDLACKFTTVDGVPCVSFTATHFSPYTIYVDTNNLQVGYMDASPKTGDLIHPKWFVTIALAAMSLFLFLKKDKVTIPSKA